MMQPQVKVKYSEESDQKKDSCGHQFSLPPAKHRPKIVSIMVFKYLHHITVLGNSPGILVLPQPHLSKIPRLRAVKCHLQLLRQGSEEFRTGTPKLSGDSEMHLA